MGVHPGRQKRSVRLLACLLALSCLLGGAVTLPAMAATEPVNLERLHVHDVIYLPTVRSQYQLQFTKPRTWQLSPSTALQLDFQHSHALLPHRSWLQVIVNDKVIKHIPLTKENAQGTRMTIPLPVGMLKDFNTLTFRIEQHYTDKCEDPLDKSLWTQILPSTQILFNYNPVLPRVDLGYYPYPIIDPLTYSPARVQYVVSNRAGARILQAMAFLNVNLAQSAGKKEMASRVTYDDATGTPAEHKIYVGTGAQLSGVQRYGSAFGDFTLSGGQWFNRRSGQTLPDDQGLLLYFPDPVSKERTILVVSGNSDEAVLRAARYLTTRPREASLTGQALQMPDAWSAPTSRSGKVPRYIETEARTFRELGYKIEEVHKINAPPITYHLPIVSDFRKENGRLFLDLIFSYGAGVNPRYSSLELRMNNVSFANIPMLNEYGEDRRRVTVEVPKELIRPRNAMVAQFHMLPDKYGFCVDNYVDKNWGRIDDNSRFRIEGSVTSLLPDVGLLNDTMFPYSREDDLGGTQISLPANPTEGLLDSMLGFTTRLGRVTASDTPLHLVVKQGTQDLDGGKSIVIFRQPSDSLKIPDGARLTWTTGGPGGAMLKDLKLVDTGNKLLSGQLVSRGDGAYIEQYARDNRHVITVVTAHDDRAFREIGRMFESDKAFEEMQQGFIQQVSLNNPELNPVTQKPVYVEQGKSLGGGWGAWFNWLPGWLKSLPWMGIFAGLLGVFFLIIILPMVMRAILMRRR